ncbi:hypothetical protein PHYSODRAFT_345055 [Phytophthora sojae]|uniref:Uncharacterized protein n=1 Tax=Phytophthora sojae (strain P6497) TaxID=1094619 RepID=G4YT22_PHYSP|nr:hypothetical protein PHYSODRAFT_345055 [Phytophthora sojae]EGZ25948.1 hypothetical protein PHYSODRAFT_345055 [Phytophthora sojae]|eukprot:XP_009521236.1 hypothetical protein PHYSODRAFT_345055 [Phytophthora sojae]
MEAGAAPRWVETTTREFPKKLPMQFDSKQTSYYYYALVVYLLKVENAKVVTVTGTPGIGKSVFYAYFLERYSYENEDITIITASFAKTERSSTKDQVVVFKKGKAVAVVKDVQSAMDALILETVDEAGDKLLYLCDGPPDQIPRAAQMVCFTSPSERWFDTLRKWPACPKLFMPLWDLDELQTAAEVLNFHSDTTDTQGPESIGDLIEQRYRIFGGVARECLSTDENVAKARQKEMERFIDQFPNEDNMGSLFNIAEAKVVQHGIGHYVPSSEDPAI